MLEARAAQQKPGEHGLLALDCVGLEVRDEAAFRADAALGQSLGYDGKLCIHPMQVAVVNALYAPDDAAKIVCL